MRRWMTNNIKLESHKQNVMFEINKLMRTINEI